MPEEKATLQVEYSLLLGISSQMGGAKGGAHLPTSVSQH